MHDIDPEDPAIPAFALPAESTALPVAAVGHHDRPREIVRTLPDWDLLPPSTVITMRRLVP